MSLRYQINVIHAYFSVTEEAHQRSRGEMLSEESRLDARAAMQVCPSCNAGKHEGDAPSFSTFVSLGLILNNL